MTGLAVALPPIELAVGSHVGAYRLLERLGFVREGLVRARALRDGEAHDHVMYGLVDMQHLKSWLPAGKD